MQCKYIVVLYTYNIWYDVSENKRRDFIQDAESAGRISPGVWWCVHDMTTKKDEWIAWSRIEIDSKTYNENMLW